MNLGIVHFVGVICVIGIIYGALCAWVQPDIKKLVAFSSVSHLGFCVLGMFALNDIGTQGSVLYMVNHGLSTGDVPCDRHDLRSAITRATSTNFRAWR